MNPKVICFSIFTILLDISEVYSQKSSTDSLKSNPAQKYSNTINTVDLFKHLNYLASDKLEGRQSGTSGQLKAANYIAQSMQNDSLKPIFKLDSSISFFQNFTFLPEGARGILSNDIKRLKDLRLSQNVIGLIEGSEFPNEIVVLSAHYDHLGKNQFNQIFNGADDNASGTSAILEIAQAFSLANQNGYKPKRTMLFVLFSGEEKGLLGSKFFIENSIFPIENYVCDLNIDMVGKSDKSKKKSNYIYTLGSDRVSKELKYILMNENIKYINLKLDFRFDYNDEPTQLFYRSDHYNFAKFNIPIIFFFDAAYKTYHLPSDDIEEIDFELLKKRTQLVFYTAWEIANMETRLKIDSKR